ncbi:putative HNHc nuclease [Secundilactobacillus muriivasis]
MKQYPILVAEHDETGGRFVYTDESQANAVLEVEDRRTITRDQQNKAYAMLGEIDEHFGNYNVELTKAQMKREYMIEREDYLPLSLADCSIRRASEFIDFLIEFCLAWGVPFASRTLDLVQGCYGWELHCLENRTCCICGNPADIAHVHAVGIGRDRNHINHVGNSAMALCRIHHGQQHNLGIHSFMNKWHLKGVRITPEIAELLRLGNWTIEYGEPIISTKEGQTQ